MSEGTVILPAALILGGFILVVFVAIPYFDRYYSNRTSWISGIVDRIGLNHVKTKFIPGLEVKERRKVLEEIFKAKVRDIYSWTVSDVWVFDSLLKLHDCSWHGIWIF